MAHEHIYNPGNWLLICDVCGKKIKASESKHRWDGLIVCHEDWEVRHPMDFLKARSDKITVPFVRPRQPDVFIEVCNMATSSGYAGLATAGCSRAGQTYGMTFTELLTSTYCDMYNKQALASIGVANCAIAA